MKSFLAILTLVLLAAFSPAPAADDAGKGEPSKPAAPKADPTKEKDGPRPPGPPASPGHPGPPRPGEGPGARFGDPRREGDGDKDGPRPRYGDWHRWTPRGEQFTPDEVREIVKAVEGKNPKLADRIKDRFAEALGKPSAPPTLTDDQIARILDVMKDREPRIAERIRQSLKDDPEKVKTILASQWPRFEKVIELKEKDPELYEAETREIQGGAAVWSLSWKLREAIKEKKDADAAQLKDQLRAKLLEQHALRSDTRMLEIERLNAKIEKLRNELDMDQQSIDSHITKAIEEIVTGTGRWSRFEGKFEKRDKDDKPQPKPDAAPKP